MAACGLWICSVEWLVFNLSKGGCTPHAQRLMLPCLACAAHRRFKKKFADLGELSEVGAAASIAGKAVDEDAPKKSGKAGAKGKRK